MIFLLLCLLAVAPIFFPDFAPPDWMPPSLTRAEMLLTRMLHPASYMLGPR